MFRRNNTPSLSLATDDLVEPPPRHPLDRRQYNAIAKTLTNQKCKDWLGQYNTLTQAGTEVNRIYNIITYWSINVHDTILCFRYVLDTLLRKGIDTYCSFMRNVIENDETLSRVLVQYEYNKYPSSKATKGYTDILSSREPSRHEERAYLALSNKGVTLSELVRAKTLEERVRKLLLSQRRYIERCPKTYGLSYAKRVHENRLATTRSQISRVRDLEKLKAKSI